MPKEQIFGENMTWVIIWKHDVMKMNKDTLAKSWEELQDDPAYFASRAERVRRVNKEEVTV